MKKNLLSLTLLGMVMIPALGLAATCTLTDPTGCTAPNLKFAESVQKILDLFFWVLMIVSVVFIMIAAFNFIMAQGDPAKSGSAMNAVRNAAIGIIIALLAKGLAVFVANLTLGGSN